MSNLVSCVEVHKLCRVINLVEHPAENRDRVEENEAFPDPGCYGGNADHFKVR